MVLLVPATAGAAQLQRPESQTEPPRFFERSAREVTRIAWRAEKVREERRHGPLDPTAYTKGAGRWQVSFFRKGDEVVQVQLDDRSGAVLEQWTGYQVAWSMARGYEGAFGRKLNAPYVWIPLCVLFLAPFVDFRRPLRLLHLDLLVLLAFGVSHVFFNRGEIGLSVPLVYPVLLYLLARVLYAGFRPRGGTGRLVPHVPLQWLLVGVVFLAAFRIGLNVVDSNVIDVGYSGVIGADAVAPEPAGKAQATPVAPATPPSAPQSLQATAGNNQVVLSWSAPLSDGGSALTGYKLFRATSPGGQGSTPLATRPLSSS